MNPLDLVESMLLNTPYKAVLFGSRANGTAKQNSDSDIALIGTSRIDPILLMNIEAIEKANFVQSVDLIDFSIVDGLMKKEIELHMHDQVA